ncbi:hypothetical protein HHUSO_G31792 [Huso huso]|uniref:Uncharacterized protein n=1 Tax=Huso huso TaxID=61971 RepID=A0ABR0YA67_HUSHU
MCRVAFFSLSAELRTAAMAHNPPAKTLDPRRQELLIKKYKDEGSLVKSGNRFILKFLKIYTEHITLVRGHMAEVLHSIFFLGNINDVKIDPMEFFTDIVGEEIKKKFPEAFEKYDTHLPTRTPFSILLDAVVLIKGNQNQKDVMEYLSALLKELSVPKPKKATHSNYYTLEATVICMCHYERNGLKGLNPNPNFYGGSLSCKGLKERKVMIALSCLEPWTPAVAYAVAFADEGAYIKLPKDVISEAFQRDLKTDSYLEKAPCTNCITIFRGVSFKPCYTGNNKKELWPYGNCAETESLSKLLKADLTLRGQVEVHNKTGIVHLDLETHQIHSKATETLVEELPKGRFVVPSNVFQFFYS